MENEKNKIKEPFAPQDTPEPPQIKDPNRRTDEPSQKEPMNAKSPAPEKADEKKSSPGKEKKGEKLLGESETEITDETTI